MIYRFDSPDIRWEFHSDGPVAGGVEPFVTWYAWLPGRKPVDLEGHVEWQCNGHATLLLTSDNPMHVEAVAVNFDYLDDDDW